MRCESCGANVQPNAAECPYCHATTAAGHAQAQARAAWEHQQAAHAAQAAAHAAHAQRFAQQQREDHLRARARTLPIWGVFGLLVPCLGVPALIAALVAWGVRGEAKRSNLPVPGQVTTTLVLSGLGGALSILLLVIGAVSSAEHEEHIATLEKRATPILGKATLSQPEACLIAEYLVERDGHADKSGVNIDGFRCDGRLLSTGPDKLLLEAMQWKSGGAKFENDVCLLRRTRWTIERIVPVGAGCDAPAADAPAADARSGASATPEPSSRRGR